MKFENLMGDKIERRREGSRETEKERTSIGRERERERKKIFLEGRKLFHGNYARQISGKIKLQKFSVHY